MKQSQILSTVWSKISINFKSFKWSLGDMASPNEKMVYKEISLKHGVA